MPHPDSVMVPDSALSCAIVFSAVYMNQDNPVLSFVDDPAVIDSWLDAVCSLESATFGAPWKRGDFVNELHSSGSRCMLLLQGDTLAGYLFAKAVLDEISLNKICVAAALRGGGLGTVLLGRFIGSMRGAFSRMFLEVDSTNTPAVKLYSRFGFTTVRIRTAIYENGADGFEMVLEK